MRLRDRETDRQTAWQNQMIIYGICSYPDRCSTQVGSGFTRKKYTMLDRPTRAIALLTNNKTRLERLSSLFGQLQVMKKKTLGADRLLSYTRRLHQAACKPLVKIFQRIGLSGTNTLAYFTNLKVMKKPILVSLKFRLQPCWRTLDQAGQACRGQPLQLIRPILTLQRKLVFCNYGPGYARKIFYRIGQFRDKKNFSTLQEEKKKKVSKGRS